VFVDVCDILPNIFYILNCVCVLFFRETLYIRRFFAMNTISDVSELTWPITQEDICAF
jgi:hypothetical protein